MNLHLKRKLIMKKTDISYLLDENGFVRSKAFHGTIPENVCGNRLYMPFLVCIVLLPFLVSSCSADSLDPESVITVNETRKNAFDEWLDVNFLTPYNIRFKYRYELYESDLDYYTVPADMESSVICAHLVKYTCIEAYDESAGVDFTRSCFPKLFFLTGEFEYRNNGTIILGTAEGGMKILLTGINYIKRCLGSADLLNRYYLKVIHHEFTHILNQTRPYTADFQLITGNGYVADSWSEKPYDTGYLERGFISSYAQHSDEEDFAEMLSMYLTNNAEWWEAQLSAAGVEGASLLESKLFIVRSYMSDTWNIDIDVLRNSIQRRMGQVINGKIDLTDLSIK